MAGQDKPTDVLTGKTTTQFSEVEKDLVDDNTEKKGKVKQKPSINPDDFYSDALSEQTINNIADGKRLLVVALVGFAKYGKTTFVSSLYYQFLTNVEFCNHIMYDSDTYVGFEKRLLIRSTKTPLDENQKRTLKGENSLLSMTLKPKNGDAFKFVISDKSGEDYESFSIDAGDVEDNKIFSVATQILLFVDSNILLNKVAYINHYYKGLLDELAKSNLIKPSTALRIVFNKVDEVPKDDATKLKFEEHKSGFEKMLSNYFPNNRILTSEIDSTGASDDYKSIKKLCQELLSFDNRGGDKAKEILDWVKKEMEE